MQHKFPFAIFTIEIDTKKVDVNVHPTKMDIKFSNFEDLCLLISNLIKEKTQF